MRRFWFSSIHLNTELKEVGKWETLENLLRQRKKFVLFCPWVKEDGLNNLYSSSYQYRREVLKFSLFLLFYFQLPWEQSFESGKETLRSGNRQRNQWNEEKQPRIWEASKRQQRAYPENSEKIRFARERLQWADLRLEQRRWKENQERKRRRENSSQTNSQKVQFAKPINKDNYGRSRISRKHSWNGPECWKILNALFVRLTPFSMLR